MAITQLDLTAPGVVSDRPVERVRVAGATGQPAGSRSSGLGTARSAVAVARDVVARAVPLVDSCSSGELEPLLRDLTRLEAQVVAAKLRVLARAERARVPAESGMSDVGAWAARATHQDTVVTSRDAKLARRLATEETRSGSESGLDSGVSATGEALAQGKISRGHCDVITGALDKLPDRLSGGQKTAVVERRLLDQAGTLTPNQLRRVARRALAEVEPDPDVVDAHEDTLLRDEEAAGLAKARFKVWNNHDGTSSGSFTVPTMQAGSLKKVLEAMTSPRRARLGAVDAQGDGIRRDDKQRFEKLSGQAFAELIERLPTDHLAKPNVTVLVTMTLDTLHGKLTAAGVDNAESLSASEARRLACGAGLVPAVLGGRSRVLDLGRTQRLFTDSQRQALALKHETCAADGCERPFAWCELHHREPWSRGGKTDLDQAIPLCWFHHRRIHNPAYHHHRDPGGGIHFTQARRC